MLYCFMKYHSVHVFQKKEKNKRKKERVKKKKKNKTKRKRFMGIFQRLLYLNRTKLNFNYIIFSWNLNTRFKPSKKIFLSQSRSLLCEIILKWGILQTLCLIGDSSDARIRDYQTGVSSTVRQLTENLSRRRHFHWWEAVRYRYFRECMNRTIKI